MVGRLLEQPEGMRFIRPPTLSPDGRLSLVTGESDGAMAVWLLDTPGLQAFPLATGTTVSAFFSPDACHVALSTETQIDGLPEAATRIVPMNGDEPLDAGDGRALAWTTGCVEAGACSPSPVGSGPSNTQ
jgi:hypothetical protein